MKLRLSLNASMSLSRQSIMCRLKNIANASDTANNAPQAAAIEDIIPTKLTVAIEIRSPSVKYRSTNNTSVTML